MGPRESRASADREFRLALSGARAGDVGAAGALFQPIRPRLLAYVSGRLPSRTRRWTSPEDVVQSVLVELLHQLHRLPEDATEDDLWRFVYRLASYRVRDAGRNHRRLNGESALGTLGLPHDAHPRTGTVTREDYLCWLADLVDSLPPRYAEVVRLCAFEELTSAQAGLVLGVSADVVRKRYEQARRSLERRVPRDGARRGG